MNAIHETIFQEPIYLVKDKVGVVLSTPWLELSTEDRLLLQKILGAIGTNLEAVVCQHQAMLNLADLPVKASRILYFGPAEKGLPQNEVITTEGVSLITTSPLSELQDDAASKQKLWKGLKQLFSA